MDRWLLVVSRGLAAGDIRALSFAYLLVRRTAHLNQAAPSSQHDSCKLYHIYLWPNPLKLATRQLRIVGSSAQSAKDGSLMFEDATWKTWWEEAPRRRQPRATQGGDSHYVPEDTSFASSVLATLLSLAMS